MHGWKIVVMLGVFILCGIALFTLGPIDGVYSGSPVISTSNGPSDIQIENGKIFEIQANGHIKLEVALIEQNLNEQVIYTKTGELALYAKFYWWGSMFWNEERSYVGWGRRLWSIHDLNRRNGF